MAIESPKYEVLEKYDGFEVRRYASFVVAETEVDGTRGDAGNSAFRLLAGYIFGSTGEPTWARYDPPWTPWFLRKNEVMLELAGPPP